MDDMSYYSAIATMRNLRARFSPGVLVLLALAVLTARGVSAQTIYVPDLQGATLARAVSMIERAGLQQGSVTEQLSTMPAGTVISQFPRPGTRAQPRERVDIVLAKAGLVVPDLTGRTVLQAEAILRGLGLRRGAVSRTQSVGTPGTVVSQSPRANTPASPGMTVDLVVVADDPQVPDLTGYTLPQADAMLKGAGLERGVVTREPSEQRAGTVISQFPRPGTTAYPGRQVNLTLSSGEPPVPEGPAPEEPEPEESKPGTETD
jgi:serine/threonine-protein kinase